MSVNSYLQNLASKLVLNESERDHVTVSVDTIINRLSNYFGREIIEKKLYGSYSRGTILPRSVDENSDIDLMLVFDNPCNYKPQSFLNRLKEFVELYYSKSEVYQSSPTIVLELKHIKFELTPAISFKGSYFIPSGQSNWMFSDPEGLRTKLTECNRNNVNKIKPVVRLLKYWNIEKNKKNISSYELETTLAEEMMFDYLFATTYPEYLKCGLERIKSKTDYYRVNSAIQHIDKSLYYEKVGFSDYAIEEIKKVFPEY